MLGIRMLGTILPFAGDYAPVGWMLCDGRVLQADEHPELFLMLRESYGGDGATTFALPDLRGRLMIGAGPAAHRMLEPGDEVPLPADPGGPLGILRHAVAVSYIICVEGDFPPPAREHGARRRTNSGFDAAQNAFEAALCGPPGDDAPGARAGDAAQERAVRSRKVSPSAGRHR